MEFPGQAIKKILKKYIRWYPAELAPPKFEPDMWYWLKQTATVQTVIDIGANNGDFAEFLTNFFGAETTYIFEPLSLYAEDLELKKNRIGNLKVFNVALSDTPGEAVFFKTPLPQPLLFFG